MNISSVGSSELKQILMGDIYKPDNRTAEEKAAYEEQVSKCGLKAYEGDIFELTKDSEDTTSLTYMFKMSGYSCLIGGTDHPGKKALAEHFGGIGKRLDEAYAAGKFTEDEYNELNQSLNEYIEKRTSNAERATAFYAIGKERGSMSANKLGEVIKAEQSQTSEEFMENLRKRIDEYVEKYYKIDRNELFVFINNFRKGE